MIVTCPSCETRYALDPANLGAAGRRVKCARCGHVWHQAPPADVEPVAAPPMAETPPETPSPRLRATTPPPNLPARPRTGPSRTKLAIWTSTALAVVAVLTLLLVGRDQVAAAWPAASGVYRALGFEIADPANDIREDPLAFTDIEAVVVGSDNGLGLRVSGIATNPNDWPLPISRLRVNLMDGERRPLDHRIFSPSQNVLAPGEAIRFETFLDEVDPAVAFIDVEEVVDEPEDG